MVLFAATFVLCKPQIDTWKEIRERRTKLDEQIRKDNEVLEKKKDWDRRLQEKQRSVQQIPAGENSKYFLPKTIDLLAEANQVQLSGTVLGEEKASGKLHILPIRYQWTDASTKGIRDLLIAFQENDVIFDVVELTITSMGQDRLKGTLTVNCVYTK
jgi:hypothetical protein